MTHLLARWRWCETTLRTSINKLLLFFSRTRGRGRGGAAKEHLSLARGRALFAKGLPLSSRDRAAHPTRACMDMAHALRGLSVMGTQALNPALNLGNARAAEEEDTALKSISK